MMRVLTLAAGLMLGLVTTVQAAPVDLHGVSADAKWLVHVDVDAMKASTVVKRAWAELVEEFPGAKRGLAVVRDRIGMDPTKDLQAITFYGNEIKKGAGVVLVRATLDQAHLLEQLKQAPDYRASTYGSQTLHTWTHDKGTRREAVVTGCFRGTSLLILGPTSTSVMAALDVLDGKLSNLAGSDSLLAAPVPEGTTVMIRATDLAKAALPVKSPLVKQSKALSIVMGEYAGEVFAKGTLVTASKEIAQQMATVVEGLRAMATLKAAGRAEMIEAINAVHVDTDDAKLTITVEASADDFWQCAHKIHEAVTAERADHRGKAKPRW